MAISASFDAFEAVRKGWQLFRHPELLGLVALSVFVASAFDIISVASDQTINTHPAATGLIMLGAGIIFFISQMYYWPRILQMSMKLAGVAVKKPAPGIVSWFIFTIRMLAVNFFCLFDRRLLAPACALLVAVFVLVPIAFIKNSTGLFDAATVLGGVGILAWLAAMLIHCIRTYFASFLFVRGDGEAGYAMRLSFERTRGRVRELLLAMLSVIVFILPLPLAIGLISIGIEKGAAMLGWPVWAGPIAGIAVTYPLAVIYGSLLPVVLAQMFGFYDKKLAFSRNKQKN